jgi:hypothetical protein
MATSDNTKPASGSQATQTPSNGTKTSDLLDPPPSGDGGTNLTTAEPLDDSASATAQ